MKIGEMAQVEQVFVQADIIGAEREIIARVIPIGTVEPGRLRYRYVRRACGIAHEDPHERLLLDDLVAHETHGGGNDRLLRDRHAFAVRIEGEAMIAAAHDIALEAALRQGEGTMRAAVLHGDRAAILAAVEEHAVAQQHAFAHGAGEFVRKAGDVPGVADQRRAMVGDLAHGARGAHLVHENPPCFGAAFAVRFISGPVAVWRDCGRRARYAAARCATHHPPRAHNRRENRRP